jgi:predicted DsbA family dithiol-disulfide isomerase
MTKVQVFYDYECPFCKRGWETLMDVLPTLQTNGECAGIEIEWRPIESHPRPEEVHPHTDLCIQAFYIAEELGTDINAFHKALFKAVIDERRNVEESEVLAEILKGIMDRGKFLELLSSGKYASKVNENNSLAYDKNDVWFIPAFRVVGDSSKAALRLDAKDGKGVNEKDMKKFFERCLVLG